MKLLTEKGQLPLPTDFAFDITKSSPFFSDEGEQSLPVNIPATPTAMQILGFPLRLANINKPFRQCAAVLSAGVFHRTGQLIFDSFSEDEISAALALSESDIYSQYTDTSLRDMFANYVRDDYFASDDKVSAWVNHIWECSAGTRSDDFTAFPIFVDKDEGSYFMLNEPDPTSTSTPWGFIYSSRNIKNGEVLVPVGYGITPLLYLHKFLDLLFAQMGYSVRSNYFSSSAMLGKIVLLNHNADTICKGVINYSDIVPSCKVGEFFDFLEKQFHCSVFVYPESKEINIVSMEKVLSESFDIDISKKVDGKIKVSISDCSRVVLDMDKSLEGAEPPAATMADFCKKYPIVSSLNEERFRAAWTYSIVYRLSTGEYYLNKRNPASSSGKTERLGSNCFKYDMNNSTASEEYKSPAVAVVMVKHTPDLTTTGEHYVAPYIGDCSHRNTSFNGDSESIDQAIMICFDAGQAANDTYHTPKYRLGTTQKYNNLGVLWGDFNITPDGLYPIFWKKYNEILLNCATSLIAKVIYSIVELMKFNLARLKCYKGTLLLPKKMGYSTGKRVELLDSEFLVIKEYSNAIVDQQPSYTEQQFKWSYESTLDEIIKRYESSATYAEWHWLDDDDSSNSDLVYMPPPTVAGLTDYHSSRWIKITEHDQFGNIAGGGEHCVECWYESVPI